MQNVMFMPHPMSQVRTLIVTASLVILTYESMELVIMGISHEPINV